MTRFIPPVPPPPIQITRFEDTPLDSVTLRFSPHALTGWAIMHIDFGHGRRIDLPISFGQLGLAQASAHTVLIHDTARMRCEGDEDAVRTILTHARRPASILFDAQGDDCRYLMQFPDKSVLAVRLDMAWAQSLRDQFNVVLRKRRH